MGNPLGKCQLSSKFQNLLYNCIQKKKHENPMKRNHLNKKGRNSALTDKEEQNIVTAICTVAQLGWPTDHDDVADIIGDYCKTMNRVTQFKNNRPGRDNMTKFFYET